MRLRRDDVIDAAMAVLDDHGLDGLTTRRVADRLGIQVGGLYWHVRDKRELLVALADRIVTDAMPDEPPDDPTTSGDWAARVIDGAQRLRAAMLRHRDGARLVTAYAPSSPRALSMAEAGLRTMRDSGLSLPAAAYAGDTIMSYVTGFVIQEQTMPSQANHADANLPAPADHPAEFPLLAEWTATKPKTRDEAFATGLNLIITGIRALVLRSPSPSAATQSAGR